MTMLLLQEFLGRDTVEAWRQSDAASVGLLPHSEWIDLAVTA